MSRPQPGSARISRLSVRLSVCIVPRSLVCYGINITICSSSRSTGSVCWSKLPTGILECQLGHFLKV